MKAKDNPHSGSDFDTWLKEEGIYEDVQIGAAVKALSHLLNALKEEQNLTVAELSRRMGTSRQQVYRLLDPKDRSVTFDTASRAAAALGKRLKVELV
jgi:antitoxin HicB